MAAVEDWGAARSTQPLSSKLRTLLQIMMEGTEKKVLTSERHRDHAVMVIDKCKTALSRSDIDTCTLCTLAQLFTKAELRDTAILISTIAHGLKTWVFDTTKEVWNDIMYTTCCE